MLTFLLVPNIWLSPFHTLYLLVLTANCSEYIIVVQYHCYFCIKMWKVKPDGSRESWPILTVRKWKSQTFEGKPFASKAHVCSMVRSESFLSLLHPIFIHILLKFSIQIVEHLLRHIFPESPTLQKRSFLSSFSQLIRYDIILFLLFPLKKFHWNLLIRMNDSWDSVSLLNHSVSLSKST